MAMRSWGLVIALLLVAPAHAQSALELETKIPLGDVGGRIDHLAVDVARQRLFVAELGNNTVGVIDLARRRVVQRLDQLDAPQGLGYVPALDALVVVNAGDGSVRFYAGTPMKPTGRLDLRKDAGNIRVIGNGLNVLVGYGKGALALIDVASRTQRGDIPLKAHPEGFQIDVASQRAFVNVPDAQEIAVVDLPQRKQIGSWAVADARANFPMARLGARGEVLSVFRSPARLVRLREADGTTIASQPTCDDADGVFHDTRRDRLYVTCGDGGVEVLQATGGGFERLGRVPTVAGARTGLFVPELDRLYVAVKAREEEAAAVWVFRPQ